MSKDGYLIDRQESRGVYGIAILMMVWHHLFGFPEQISFENGSVFGNLFMTAALYLAYFCKLCVAVYAFLSGYGLAVKLRRVNKPIEKVMTAGKQMLHFFLRYWLVFLFWIPLGIVLGKVNFDTAEWTKNLFGLSCTYNTEWWYVLFYIKMLAIAPMAQWLFSRLKQNRSINRILLPVLVIGAAFVNGYSQEGWLTYPMSFLIGIIFNENKLFEKFDGKVNQNKSLEAVLTILCIAFSVLLKFTVSPNNRLDYLLAPLFVYGCAKTLKIPLVKRLFNRILQVFGNYSIYIWLTHTFLIYYYFQEAVIKLNAPVVTYLGVLCITLLFGMLADRIYRCLAAKSRI